MPGLQHRAQRTLFFIDPLTGETKGTMLHPRPQNSRENCTWHNFNVVPTKAGYYATVGSYQSGISVFDFSNPARAARDRLRRSGPAHRHAASTAIVLGGDWSTYWHNGYIYESDIKRGLITWQLNLGGDATAAQANEHLKRTNTFALSNPQTQNASVPAREREADHHGRLPGRRLRASSSAARSWPTSPAPTTSPSSPAPARSPTARR